MPSFRYQTSTKWTTHKELIRNSPASYT